MSDKPDSVAPADAAQGGLTPQQLARRQLLRGGAAATPIILTIASNPVLAGNGQCTAASAFTSINGSRTPKTTSCTGRTPAWWCDPLNDSAWPKLKYPKSMLFQTCLGSAYANCFNMTLLQVMQLPATTGNDCSAKHIVAALLNAATNKTFGVLDEAGVKAIWSSFCANGYKYQPTPGVWWYADYSTPAGAGALTDWLKSTMI